MNLARGFLFVQIDGEYVRVAPCTVDLDSDRDGHGCWVVEEHERNSANTGDPVTYRRIGSITEERWAELTASVDGQDEEHEASAKVKAAIARVESHGTNLPGYPYVGEDGTEHCFNCDAAKRQWEQRNHSQVYPDYDWYCGVCGVFLRVSSS